MGLFRSPGAMESSGVRRDRSASSFAPIIFTGVGTTFSWEVMCRVMGGGTEWGSLINYRKVVDRGRCVMKDRRGRLETYNNVSPPTELQRLAPNNGSVSVSIFILFSQ